MYDEFWWIQHNIRAVPFILFLTPAWAGFLGSLFPPVFDMNTCCTTDETFDFLCLYSSLSGAWILDLHNKKKVKKGQRNCSILIFRYGYCRKLSDYSHRQSMHRRLGTAHEGSKPTISPGGRLALPIEHRKGGFGKHVGAKVRPETQKGSILLLGECNFLCHWCINVDTNYSSSDWIPLWFPYKKSVKPAMNLGFYIQAHIAL